MTIKELIKRLEKCNPNLEVELYCDDGNNTIKGPIHYLELAYDDDVLFLCYERSMFGW